MVRYILCLNLLTFTLVADEYIQRDVDNFKLLIKMSEKPAFFVQEISRLKESFNGTPLEAIAAGYFAFKDGAADKGVSHFKTIKEKNPYFELMTQVFRESLLETDKAKKEHYAVLLRMLFETHLIDKQELSLGCVLGAEHSYAELVKNDPEKKAEFEIWLDKKWQEFYTAAPGNWYHFAGYGFDVDEQKLQKVTEPVEMVLLGLNKPHVNFANDWGKVNSLKADYFGRLERLKDNNFDKGVISALLEELRLHVLAGKIDIVQKSSPAVKSYIKYLIQSVENVKDRSDIQKELLGKYYYIQGVSKFIVGRNKLVKTLDASEDIIGKHGAAVFLYKTRLHGGESKWVKKAKKLYELIQSNTQAWFGKSIKDFPAIQK